MESQDPRDIRDYREERRLYGKGRMAAIVIVLALLVAVLLMLAHPGKVVEAADKTKAVVNAVSAPSSSQQGEARTDPELRLQNSELKKQVADLNGQIKAKDAALKEKDGMVASKERQVQSAEKVLADTTTERDKYRDLYNNGPLFWDRMRRAQGWHLHFGGIVSTPVVPDFRLDPTVTLLAGVGPERWQVLVGLGGNIDTGLSVSIGFMWTMGDIGREKRKK